VHNFIDELMEMIVSKKLVADDIISHRLPLAKAADGYSIFNKKQENCTKVVLNPWA
jgi:alcohol dehydrogenase